MNEDSRIRVNRDGRLECLAAEVTLAAYRVALRTGTRGNWLDLELDLWKAVVDVVETSGRKASRCLARDVDLAVKRG